MTPDGELLRQYASQGDEAAFAEVVQRYVDLVYSTALRLVAGDTHLAQDVAQSVFTDLARKAVPLSDHRALGGWLHTATRYAAAKIVHHEHRRRANEQEAYVMQNDSTRPEVSWDLLVPLLDDAVGHLSPMDRDAVILRFFEGRSHRDVGAAIGVNEDTARKRIDRALEKLRADFARRGVTVSSALLGSVIVTNSVQAAPVGLAMTLTNASLAGASGAGLASTWLEVLSSSTKTKSILLAAVVLLFVIPIMWQAQEITQLQNDLAGIKLVKPSVKNAGPMAATPKKLTLEEIEAKLAAALQGNANEWHAFISGGDDRAPFYDDTPAEIDDLLKSLDPADVPEVLAFLENVPETQNNHSLIGDEHGWHDDLRAALLNYWGWQGDPLAALNYVMAGKPNSKDSSDDIRSVLEGWARQDAYAAADWLKQLPAENADKMSMGGLQIIEALSIKDPAQAYALFSTFYDGKSAHIPFELSKLFSNWVALDSTVALQAALSLAPGIGREYALEGLADGWSVLDPTAALAWGETLTNEKDKSNYFNEIASKLTNANPAQAAQYILAMPAGPARDDSIATVVEKWAEADPDAAMAWMRQLPDGDDKQNAQAGIAKELAGEDITAAIAFAQNMPAGSVQNKVLGEFAKNWVYDDPVAGSAWIKSLPASTSQTEMVEKVFETNIAYQAARDVAGLVTLLPPDQQADAASEVARDWPHKAADFPSAITWIATLPEGKARNDAAEHIADIFANAAPAQVTQWMEAMPPGSAKDAALQSFVGDISGRDPAQAAMLAGTIGDGNDRNDAIEFVAQKWLKIDPAAANAWLAKTSLPKDRQQALLIQSQRGAGN